MDTSAQRHAAAARSHVPQSPSSVSNSSSSPVDGPPRPALSTALLQSRSNQGSPIIGVGAFSRTAESPRSLQGSMTSTGASRDSPLTTPRNNQHPGGPVRTNSTPQVNSTKDSPPNSAAALAMEKRRNMGNRLDESHMLRTSSMDSSHSSMSSATNMSQTSTAMDGGPSSADIAVLIQSAGSAENLIRQLLKEKRGAAAQNNQLFKLLNKQKSMMQGMHVDLEKAMVDRERYKKIAEQLTTIPITPEAPWQIRKPSPAISTSSAPSTASMDQLPIQRFPEMEASLAINGTSSHSKADTGLPPALKSAPMPRTLSDATVRPEGSHSKRDTAIKDRPAPLAPQSAKRSGEKPTSPKSPQSPQTSDGSESPQTSFTARRSMTQRKDNGQQSGPSSPTENVPGSPSARKAPPAPLNLGKPPQASPTSPKSPEDFGPADHTESDYTESDLDTDDLPTFDRGRKATREMDDQEREVIMIRAHRASQSAAKEKSRSKSSKKSSVKGQKSPATEELPKSPSFKSFSPPESPGKYSTGQPASIASMLNTQSNGGTSTVQQTVLSPALKSPGLPLSPRPQDRPANAPVPRSSNEGNTAGSTPVPAPQPTQKTSSSLALSPRPPRHAIPMPTSAPTGPLPQPPMSAPLQQRPSQRHDLLIPQSAALQSPPRPAHQPHFGVAEHVEPQSGTIFKGLVSDAYPDLLLPPNALPSIAVKITSSRLRPSRQSTLGVRNSTDESVFTLGIYARSHRKQLWRVEKAAVSLMQLEHQLKATQMLEIRVPDRSLFTGHAPARIDARRSALETFFETLLDTPLNEKAAVVLCKYFSTQAIPAEESLHERGHSSLSSIKDRESPEKVVKEGYLTKKGKNFGGWKARYFVLNEPVLRYYESPGGSILGAIRLTNAQIGRQASHKRSPSRSHGEEDADSQYRHAFLIMEPKRNNPAIQNQHVLCAESDEERDEWVEALMFYIGKEPEPNQDKDKAKSQAPTREGSGRDKASLLQTMMKEKEKRDRPSDASEHPPEDALRGFSYSESTAGQAPVMKGSLSRNTATPPPTTVQAQSSPNQRNISGPKGGMLIEDPSLWGNKDPMSTSKDMISGPKNAQPITDASSWGNKDVISKPLNAQPITNASQWGNKSADRLKPEESHPPPSSRLQIDKAEKEVRKRSFWGFRGHSTSDSATGLSSSVESDSAVSKKAAVRPVFGIPLAEAVQYCLTPGSATPLPSVAYRCLEFLESVGADMEEGLFRISGSTVIINRLKERFNLEGDVDLINEKSPGRGGGGFDVHAIASLFKLYLRELPERILTNALYPQFLAAQELETEAKRVAALNVLVHKLPFANWTMTFNLMKFLVQVDGSSEMSKMTVRNIGIVFAPTLNLSNPIIAHFIRDFHAIFETDPPADATPDSVGIEVTAASPRLRNGLPGRGGVHGAADSKDDSSASGLGLHYEEVLQSLHLDDNGSMTSDSTRVTNSSSARGTPVSLPGGQTLGGPEYGPPIVQQIPGMLVTGSLRDTMDSKQKRRESSMQMLMGGFPGPGTTTHKMEQRKMGMPLTREE